MDLDYCNIEWFALEMNRGHSVIGCHSVTSPGANKCPIWEVIWGTVFKSQEMRTQCLQITYITFHNQGKLEVVKQEMAKVSIDILGITELEWTGMGAFNSDDHYIYDCGQESLEEKE